MQKEIFKRIKFNERRKQPVTATESQSSPPLPLKPLKAARQHIGTETPPFLVGSGPITTQKMPGKETSDTDRELAGISKLAHSF
jgi:hypothetical protein